MGVVRAAHDRLLGREVAHKRALRHTDGTIIARFVREAKITAFLEHPAIVPVYDAGTGDDGEPYYTMRLVRGKVFTEAIAQAASLADRLRLLRHFHDVCEAVGYAHRHGIVHRDLKPDNVLVGEFGETQVVDWGLARRLDEQVPPATSVGGPPGSSGNEAAAQHESGDSVTQVGAVVGTPIYMSPEQARGDVADQRSDVWGLGVILWQILCGETPSTATAAALRRGEVASSGEVAARLPAGAPRDLVAIMRRALAPDPAERYVDAKAMADDVATYLDGGLVAAHAYSPWEQLSRLVKTWRGP